MSNINLFYSLPLNLQRKIFMMEQKDKKMIADKITEELSNIKCLLPNGDWDYKRDINSILKPSRVKPLRQNVYESCEHYSFQGRKNGKEIWEHRYYDYKENEFDDCKRKYDPSGRYD